MRLTSLLSICSLLSTASADAQRSSKPALPARVRFVVATAASDVPWTGELVGFTRDSVAVRSTSADSVQFLARAHVLRLEVWRHHSVGKAVGIGCASVGAIFGFLAWGNGQAPSNGSEHLIGRNADLAIGAIAGCTVGAVGGLVVGVLHRSGWEPLVLPVE